MIDAWAIISFLMLGGTLAIFSIFAGIRAVIVDEPYMALLMAAAASAGFAIAVAPLVVKP